MPEFIVNTSEDSLGLLDFLGTRIPAAPRAYLRQLLKRGQVCKSGSALTNDQRLTPGDCIQLPASQRLLELLDAKPKPSVTLTIVYESREILVVNKPAGLAVHSSRGHEQDNLTARVEALLRQRGAKFKVAPVHRLDLETSGPLLFGKGKLACGRLGQLFMQHQVAKDYLALVVGKTAACGRLESTLCAKGKQKLAHTDFRTLAANTQASLLELRLHTGRQHQIRRQLAEQGHPLFGDRRYRGCCPAGLARLFLHCSRLAFVDPFHATPITVTSPLPEDLKTFLARCALDPADFTTHL